MRFDFRISIVVLKYPGWPSFRSGKALVSELCWVRCARSGPPAGWVGCKPGAGACSRAC